MAWVGGCSAKAGRPAIAANDAGTACPTCHRRGGHDDRRSATVCPRGPASGPVCPPGSAGPDRGPMPSVRADQGGQHSGPSSARGAVRRVGLRACARTGPSVRRSVRRLLSACRLQRTSMNTDGPRTRGSIKWPTRRSKVPVVTCACRGNGADYRPCGWHWSRLSPRERAAVAARLGIRLRG